MINYKFKQKYFILALFFFINIIFCSYFIASYIPSCRLFVALLLCSMLFYNIVLKFLFADEYGERKPTPVVAISLSLKTLAT